MKHPPEDNVERGMREEKFAEALFGVVGHLVRRAHQATVATFLNRMAEYDVTPAQFVTLYIIAHLPGADQATVAGYAALDRSNVGDVIKRLERRGLVRRQQNRDDKRARLLFLTEEGRRLFAAMEPRVHDIQEDVMAPLTPEERRIFKRLLGKVAGVDRSIEFKPFSRARDKR